MFEETCCQSLHQSQEHGKANTQLISKTSKGVHFLPKITRTCPSVYASLPLSLSAAPPSFSPLCLHSIPSASHHSVKLFLHSKFWNKLCHHSSLLFWSVPGVKALGIFSVSPVQEQCGPPMPGALESSFTHKAHTQTHKISFLRGDGALPSTG